MSLHEKNTVELDHTADFSLRMTGKDMKDLFQRAAEEMTKIMVKMLPAAAARYRKISVKAQDPADLMVRWLGEILYLLEGEKMIVNKALIDTISPAHLHATLGLSPYDPETHVLLREIKGVTYHQIGVHKKKGYWEARIIFDL